jgi:HK97 family phage major capsid protein
MTAQMKDEDIQNLIKLAADLEKAAEEVNKKGDTLQKEVKNLGDATGDTKKQVDDALSKYGELSKEHGELVKKHGEAVNRIAEIEQTVAQRRQQQEPAPQKSLGEIFVESDAFKSFNGKGNIRVPMNRKDIMNVTATVGSNTSPANSLVGVLRVPGIVMPPTRKLTIRDLVASGQTSQGMVEYAQEVAFTNAAAVVTEGSTKPQSNITFELKTAPVRTIATLFKASRQILDDAPALRSYIDARATYGLRLTEEDELLNGDGTGAHLKGLIPSATAFNAAFVATAKQRMDTIRLGILQVFQSNFPASGIVLNPVDWAAIQLTKDSQQRYIIGNPADGNVPRLWNLPVVESLSMPATEFLVGAFDIAAQIFDRLDIEILLSTENSTDFEKNMVTIRAEERLAFAIYSPLAIVHGDFDTAT